MTPSKPSHLPKIPSSDTMTLGLGFQHANFGGDRDIQSIWQRRQAGGPSLYFNGTSELSLEGCVLQRLHLFCDCS